ncbi:hypothetical protein ABH935_009582 [Catenulispora sp. GAS73]
MPSTSVMCTSLESEPEEAPLHRTAAAIPESNRNSTPDSRSRSVTSSAANSSTRGSNPGSRAISVTRDPSGGSAAAVTDLKQFADRGHSLVFDSGWREIADYVLTWLADNLSDQLMRTAAGQRHGSCYRAGDPETRSSTCWATTTSRTEMPGFPSAF